MTSMLITLGETLVLLASPEPGPLRHAGALRLGIGGAESNVAIGVSRLGGRSSWIGRVGDDELGELVLRTLRAEGVGVERAIVDGDVSTSLMLKERRTNATTRVTYYRDHGPGARLRPEDVDEAAIAAAGALHVTGITLALSSSARAAVHAAAHAARAAGVPVSFDVNHRSALWTPEDARHGVEELLPLADHVFVGHREARTLGWEGSPEEVAHAIRGRGPEVVVVKLGHRGAIAVGDGAARRVAPLDVASVDPVGAGDAFAAGYLAELLAGAPLDVRLATAAACGAYAVTANGDWEGLPGRDDLRALDEPGEVLR